VKEFHSFYKSIEDRKANTWCRYTKRLDTYGCGCQHDCSYCYSKSLLNFRGLWNALEPSGANLSKIKNRIKQLPRKEVIKLGGMTDCFQPIEKVKKLTYQTIQILNQYRISYLIVTKSSLVSNPEYLKIYDKKLAHFQITLTSTSSNKYEKASSPVERIKSIETLQDLGFDVSVRLSPFIAQNIDFDVLNGIKCDKVLIEFLKVNHWVKKWFDIDYLEYTVKYGGYEHLPLDKKIELVNNITGFDQITVGEYVAEHHEYFSKNVNYNEFDCCNLTNDRIFQNEKQLTLF
jgi:DNA repair photolyase